VSLEDTVRDFMASVQEGIARGHAIVARLTALCDRLEEINGVTARRIRKLKAAMASEADLLKPFPKRTRKRIVLDSGEIAEPAPGRTLCATYLRSAYNAGDVKLLQQVIDAKKKWTFAEVMQRKNALRRKP